MVTHPSSGDRHRPRHPPPSPGPLPTTLSAVIPAALRSTPSSVPELTRSGASCRSFALLLRFNRPAILLSIPRRARVLVRLPARVVDPRAVTFPDPLRVLIDVLCMPQRAALQSVMPPAPRSAPVRPRQAVPRTPRRPPETSNVRRPDGALCHRLPTASRDVLSRRPTAACHLGARCSVPDTGGGLGHLTAPQLPVDWRVPTCGRGEV